MQDTSVGWDPVFEYHAPLAAKMLLLYLLAVLLFSVVRSASLIRQLWFFAARKLDLLQESGNSDEKARLLAASGLANKLPSEVVNKAAGGTGLLRQAEGRFLYAWEICSAKVRSLKRLAVLTFLLSTIVCTFLITAVLQDIAVEKATHVAAFSGVLAEALVFFGFGIFVCTVLYSAYALYEGMLTRRKASWNYFCAKARQGSPQAGDQ